MTVLRQSTEMLRIATQELHDHLAEILASGQFKPLPKKMRPTARAHYPGPGKVKNIIFLNEKRPISPEEEQTIRNIVQNLDRYLNPRP